MTPSHATCDFCGLPLAGSLWTTPEACGSQPGAAQYCCFGCRFAAAVTRERGETGAIRWTMTRLGLSIFLSMNVMAFTMALWTGDVYGSDGGGTLAASLFGLFRYLCLVLSLPVLILLGGPILENAWQALRRGALSTDLLLLSGVVAAFVYSAISVVRDQGPIYFEVACVILVMVTLGRWFEAAGRLRAGAALDELQRLLPETVRRIRDGAEASVATAELAVGDQIRVLPGERFPVDGRLVRGMAAVDEQILTGESRPVTRRHGDTVSAGTLNLDGDVLVETSLPPGAGTLPRLIELVRRAREAKGRYQVLADRLSALVFPIVTAIALAAFAWHWRASGLEQGLLAGLAVVLVACPCALGLATPLAVWAALGAAARRQVLFRSGEALERLAEIRALRFDKTGTLTTGNVRVADFITATGDDSASRTATLQAAAGLAASSLHPFSRAILAFAGPSCAADRAADVRLFSGRGISGRIDGESDPACLGSRSFMNESGLTLPDLLKDDLERGENAGRSVTYLGWNGQVRGAFVFEEDLRDSAPATLTWLQKQGYDVAVLTGDRRLRAERLADELHVPVVAELLPEQKLAAIREVRERVGPVAMVGDGINDAPALAASDVGIALGCGTDVSRDSAAVCLLGNDLTRLTWAIEFSRHAVRVLRRNLIWAFAYNTVGIALAATGRLNPALAALLMVVSSALVIRRSLSLQRTGKAEDRAVISDVAASGGRAPVRRELVSTDGVKPPLSDTSSVASVPAVTMATE
ncbi:MAG: heavy metal translocating P-type ATPase [Deltaproteobacteria bacterium]